MGDKTVSVRVRFEGGDQVKAGLQEVGREGTRAIQNIGTVSSQTGAKLQNAGYQVSDFFVQVAGGTAPSRALAQQLPQLLQGFGLLGVAASVLIAALPSLWSMFGSGVNDIKAVEEQLKSLSESMRAWNAAVTAANQSPGSLVAQFGGENLDQARKVLDIQRQIAAARAENSLVQASSSLASLFGDPANIDLTLRKIAEVRAQIAAARSDPSLASTFDFDGAARQLEFYNKVLRSLFAGIGDQIGVELEGAEAEVAALARSLIELNQAEGASATAAALSGVRSALVEAVAAGGEMNEEVLRLLQGLTDAELAALGLSQVDIAAGIIPAVGASADLAANLWDATAAQKAFNLAHPGVYSGRGDDPRKFMGGGPQPFNPSKEIVEQADIMLGLRSAPRGGRGGGGGADPDIARAKALTEGVRTETEKYAAALEEVNRLKQKGLITDETYNRQLDKLNDKLVETGDLGKKAASAIRSAFDGIFDDPQQALKDLAKQLAMMALYQGLAKGFPTIFGGGGFVPLVPGFASGGRHRGGLRIVGENGPELEATGPSTIYPNDLLQSLGRGRSAPVIVNVTNQSGAAVETTAERGGPNGERIIDMKITESLTSGRQDKALRRFGSKPQRVLR